MQGLNQSLQKKSLNISAMEALFATFLSTNREFGVFGFGFQFKTDFIPFQVFLRSF